MFEYGSCNLVIYILYVLYVYDIQYRFTRCFEYKE